MLASVETGVIPLALGVVVVAAVALAGAFGSVRDIGRRFSIFKGTVFCCLGVGALLIIYGFFQTVLVK